MLLLGINLHYSEIFDCDKQIGYIENHCETYKLL